MSIVLPSSVTGHPELALALGLRKATRAQGILFLKELIKAALKELVKASLITAALDLHLGNLEEGLNRYRACNL